MTTKYLKLFIITTLFSYQIMSFSFSSSGLRHYFLIKKQINSQKKELLEIERDVISLQKYKIDLQNGEYILDDAFALGYVNEGDIVHFDNEYKSIYSKTIIPKEMNDSRLYNKNIVNNQSNLVFFIISVVIGLVLTISFSVISKKRKSIEGKI